MATPYITGLTALCIMHPGRYKPFWHHFGSPDAWQIAGKNHPDTTFFFGEQELVDVSETFALWGIEPPLCVCASYERAVFDLLYLHIEQKGRMVPNVQPSDIDDVVDFKRILVWVSECERAGQLKRGPAMRAWLTSDSFE
jgi:hypothetical protein